MATDKPKIDRIRLLAVKAETTTGVPIAVSASDATMKTFNLRMTPDDNTLDRELQAAKGQDKSEPGTKTGTCTFETELTGGTSEPKWATLLLPACDWEATGGVYYATNGVTTLTLVMYHDGLKKTLYGARGTFEIMADTGQIPRISWTFTGKYLAEADASILDPTYETALAPAFQGGTNTVTIGTFSPLASSMRISANNTVVYRESANDPHTDSAGIYAAAITDRRPTLTIDPETVAIASKDWGSIRELKTESVITVTLGTVAASNRVTITCDRAQVTRRPIDQRNGLLVNQLTFQLNGASNSCYFDFPDA